MPLQCPHCRIAQAVGNATCINCGRPLTPAPAAPLADPAPPAGPDAGAHPVDHDSPASADPVHDLQAQRSSWRLPALIAAGLVAALVAWALLSAPRPSGRHAARPASALAAVPPTPGDVPPPSSLPAAPAVPVTPKARAERLVAAETAPLTISLASTRAGRHVRIGDPVTLTAFTALAQGQSATLTVFYRRGRGPKTMLSFVQGSLCSTTWTPTVPGRYEFTATAHGDRRQAAASRRIEITVDQPAGPRNQPVPPLVAHRRPPVAAPPPLVAQTRLSVAAPAPPRPRKTAARAPRPVPSHAYHVAAAVFYFPRSAAVLAEALNRHGYHAVPERMAGPHGKSVYVVVTGGYRRPGEAHTAALALQRSGYQAYVFGGP